MNKLAASAAILALLILGQPKAEAVIVVAADYPITGESAETGQAASKSQLSELIGLYNNDVALLINPTENFSQAIKDAVADPAIEKELLQLALANSDQLTLQSLSAAVSDMVAAAPQNAHIIMASAIAMLSNLPGGDSPANNITLAQTALLAISPTEEKGADYAALVIGVAAKGQKPAEAARTVIALRAFASSGLSPERQVATTLALDKALVSEGVLQVTMATPEFSTLAQAFATTPPPNDSEFSGDQGAITTGGGGFGGSSGGTGNNSGQQTPTPTPTPAPTPAS